jgi:hypothetical protein
MPLDLSRLVGGIALLVSGTVLLAASGRGDGHHAVAAPWRFCPQGKATAVFDGCDLATVSR